MYDKATQSLWNTLRGRPVIGSLVGKGIVLKRRSVVTTTWGAWRMRHPNTTVLSPDTGHVRDYGEGVAYRDYFATDRLMFNVAPIDRRLANKAEVLGLIFGDKALAIDVAFLRKNPIHHGTWAGRRFVVLTDKSGAARVYAAPAKPVTEWDGANIVRDASGQTWMLHEDRLQSSSGTKLSRLPQHRAFWFGWFAAFPKTELVTVPVVRPAPAEPRSPSRSGGFSGD